MNIKKIIKPIGIAVLSIVTWSFVNADEILSVKPINTKINKITELSTYTKALVDFDVFEKITAEAKIHRSTRLIDFSTFNRYSHQENTVILDTRSKRMYDRMHIKGAIHINFSDFTQEYLAEMIPDKNTRILIYCNNNFVQEPIFEEVFISKVVTPIEPIQSSSIPGDLNFEKPYSMALNIPTYINLYGYQYLNVYELDELVSTSTPGLVMAGTDILDVINQDINIKN